eukprot:scaffold40095_cov18-Phaeocystis_antarctica.AAC.1
MGCCGGKERSGSSLEGGRADIGAAGWAALRAASDAAGPVPVILTKEQHRVPLELSSCAISYFLAQGTERLGTEQLGTERLGIF